MLIPFAKTPSSLTIIANKLQPLEGRNYVRSDSSTRPLRLVLKPPTEPRQPLPRNHQRDRRKPQLRNRSKYRRHGQRSMKAQACYVPSTTRTVFVTCTRHRLHVLYLALVMPRSTDRGRRNIEMFPFAIKDATADPAQLNKTMRAVRVDCSIRPRSDPSIRKL